MRQHEPLCFPRDRLLTSWYRLTCQCRIEPSESQSEFVLLIYGLETGRATSVG